MPEASAPETSSFGIRFASHRVTLVCALLATGCASPLKSPLHLSFEDLGYASEDVGSFRSNKYRSVVNIAGLAPLSSVGSLHNRPQRYAVANPLRFFNQNSLPDYYSLALTTNCSKVLELIFDTGVTADDVWTVRKQLEQLVSATQKNLAQVTRKRMAENLVNAYGKSVAAVALLQPEKIEGAAETNQAIAEEMFLRSLIMRLLDIPDSAALFDNELMPNAEQSQALASPSKTNLAAYQAGVKTLNGAFSKMAKSLPVPKAETETTPTIDDITSQALRKGVIVTRWSAESLSDQSAKLGSIAGKQAREGRSRQGFLVMGGIRLSQIMLGNDFLVYWERMAKEAGSGIDYAVPGKYMVLYTVGARHRTFFEEASNDLLERFQLSLDAQQVSQIIGGPASSGIKNVLSLLREQSISYQQAVAALVSAGEQGFMQPPRARLYEFRFDHEPGQLMEQSMLAEKIRSATYTPIYSVRSNVVQSITDLLKAKPGNKSECNLKPDHDLLLPIYDSLFNPEVKLGEKVDTEQEELAKVAARRFFLAKPLPEPSEPTQTTRVNGQ